MLRPVQQFEHHRDGGDAVKGERCGEYRVHPVAAIFPMMADEDLKTLADDISVNGLRDSIVLARDESIADDEWLVIDGRNRFRACELAGVEPRFLTNQLLDAQSIGRWIVSTNLHRRHLTASQRAAVAVAYERVFAEAAKARQRKAGGNKFADQQEPLRENLPERSGDDTPPRSDYHASDEAGELFNVSGRSVRDAKFVAENDPEAFEEVRGGKASVSAAAKKIRGKSPAPVDVAAKRCATAILKRGNEYAHAVLKELTERLG